MIILLYILWLLLNGRFTADAGMLQICITGIPVVLFAYFVAVRFLGITPAKELKFWKKLPLLLLYAVCLVKEIVVSNFRMAAAIAGKKENNEPVIIRVRIPLKTDLCRVILANSITLTPGTITADMEDDVFVVHCIDAKFADGIDAETSIFIKMLERMEK